MAANIRDSGSRFAGGSTLISNREGGGRLVGVVNFSGAGGRKKLHLEMGCSSGATRGL